MAEPLKLKNKVGANIYILRKRIAGKLISTYVDVYSDILDQLL